MKHKKKLIIGGITIVAVIVIIIIAIISSMAKSVSKTPFNTTNNISFSIDSNENISTLIDSLSNKGFINHSTLAKLDISMSGTKVRLTPGDYTIKGSVTLGEFLNILNEQNPNVIDVVIPEGYTVDQIATKLSNFGFGSQEEILKDIENYPLPQFIKKANGKKYQLEGYLFPTTYKFTKGESINNIIQNMINMFVLGLHQSMKETGVKITPAQIETIVTKASIIQSEGNNFNNMKLISSVIDNRLKAGMPLQMDATVIYALGKHVDKVYNKDLKIDSPYNTYIHKGLPIGPICNPGEKAIEAALKPDNTDYLYYILNGNQKYFTNNYENFLQEKSKMLK